MALPNPGFWSKVDARGDCWEWTAYIDKKGYGKYSFRVGGRVRSSYAHRSAYERLVGPVPTGLDLDHRCRNPRCLNPDHLEVVTRRVNLLRSPITGPGRNARKTHCPRGHAFDETNTHVVRRASGKTYRSCRACWPLYQERQRAKKSA